MLAYVPPGDFERVFLFEFLFLRLFPGEALLGLLLIVAAPGDVDDGDLWRSDAPGDGLRSPFVLCNTKDQSIERWHQCGSFRYYK